MTPAKLKQIYRSFKTSEQKYNQQKVKLTKAYSELLRQAAIEKKWRRFDDIAYDAKRDLGSSFEFTKSSIEILYKR